MYVSKTLNFGTLMWLKLTVLIMNKCGSKLLIKNKDIAVEVIYRPPKANFLDFLESLEDTLLSITHSYGNVVCKGDPNMIYVKCMFE